MEDLNKSIENKNYKLKGDFYYASLQPFYVNFTEQQNGRYVTLLSVDHDSYGTGADFSLYSDYAPLPYSEIRSSNFDLDYYEFSDNEKSKFLTFYYKPFIF